MDLIQAALEPNTEVTAFQSKGGISTSCSLIERHGYIVLIQGFLLTIIPNCIFDKRRHLLQKKKGQSKKWNSFCCCCCCYCCSGEHFYRVFQEWALLLVCFWIFSVPATTCLQKAHIKNDRQQS